MEHKYCNLGRVGSGNMFRILEYIGNWKIAEYQGYWNPGRREYKLYPIKSETKKYDHLVKVKTIGEMEAR